jgi:hypothetical protein
VHWFPAIPASFINLSFLTSQLIKWTGVEFGTQILSLEFINALMVVILLGVFIYSILIKKIYETASATNLLMITGFFSMAALLLLLGYLSFTYEVQKGFINNWNYISEPRYYAFLFLFIQILFVGWIFKNEKKPAFLKLAAVAGLFFLSVEIVHNLYFYTRVALNFKEYKSSVFREQDYAYFNSLLAELKKEKPEKDILAASPGDKFYSYTASFYGCRGIADAEKLKSGLPAVKKNSLLLLVLYDNEIAGYNFILQSSKTRLLKKIQYSNFYLVELIP